MTCSEIQFLENALTIAESNPGVEKMVRASAIAAIRDMPISGLKKLVAFFIEEEKKEQVK